MLMPIAQNIWIAQLPLLPLATLATMTIIKIGQRLIVLSPIKGSPDLFQEIDTLGQVDVIISPNGFHHKYFLDFVQKYPRATYFYSSAAKAKVVPRIPMNVTAHVLCESKPAWWANDVQPLLIGGMPAVQEFVFYHAQSKTLVAFDTWFYPTKKTSTLARLFWFLAGVVPLAPRQSRLFKFHIKNKSEYNKSIERLMQLDIERIVVAHEKTIEGKKACRSVLSDSRRKA